MVWNKFEMVKFYLFKITLCFVFCFCCVCCRKYNNSDILCATVDELLLPEKKELLRLHEVDYKNNYFQITGEIIFKGQAIDYIPSKNQSWIFFGERGEYPEAVYASLDKVVICYFDTMMGYDLFDDGDNVVIQGKFKEIRNTGSIIFEKCQIVRPAFVNEHAW